MVKQKTICLKLDNWLMEELENECRVSGEKRNRLINKAVTHYIKYLDTRRLSRIFDKADIVNLYENYISSYFYDKVKVTITEV